MAGDRVPATHARGTCQPRCTWMPDDGTLHDRL